LTLKTPKLLPDLFAFTKQGSPNSEIMFSIEKDSPKLSWIDFAEGMLYLLNIDIQSLLLKVNDETYELLPVYGISLSSR